MEKHKKVNQKPGFVFLFRKFIRITTLQHRDHLFWLTGIWERVRGRRGWKTQFAELAGRGWSCVYLLWFLACRILSACLRLVFMGLPWVSERWYCDYIAFPNSNHWVVQTSAGKNYQTGNTAALLEQEVSTTSSSKAPLKKIGFNPTDTALILDLIVYLALENIAFYRFLDLDSCESLLSWMDFEYLAEKGSYKDRYRSEVLKQCSTLNTALKTFAFGLEQVLELHHPVVHSTILVFK